MTTEAKGTTTLEEQRNQWKELAIEPQDPDYLYLGMPILTDFAKDRIDEYVKMVQLKNNEYWKVNGFTWSPPPTVFTQTGKRYVRIVKEDSYPISTNYVHRSKSVHTFIDLRNGDILKAGTWKQPARNGTRGNLCSSDIGASVVDWHGAKYLK
jgi:hypothetical protein